MTDHRRNGDHPNPFSHEIRAENGGGTIPAEWGLRVIDLDTFYSMLGDLALRVDTEGRIWLWYDEPAEIVAVAELKTTRDEQRSWVVTQAIARLACVPGFKITRHANGEVGIEDLGGARRTFASTRECVREVIKPLFDAHREQKAAA